MVIAFFTFSFESIFCIIDNINFSLQGELMSNIDAAAVAQRIDTVLDILVAGDYHSAIRNLEILKSELLAENGADNAPGSTQPKAPWEV
ncbi:hypothetical protein GVI70_05925 [Enterobacter hormaechei]|nr:hypothetical protein HMPREF9086_2580 [Enterobacter hormaechei ATCC 49162]EGQ5310929.1 hypothetical protein [Enterobacter hormaechei]EGQ5315979.1 hypothetical protein [Enterobacter hormaechei]EGQ5326068.1 hypothetical protein [Enterobacter hormaechei]MBH0220930.1 hypothetical protein [Enterobacter hormaechei]